MVCIIPVVLFKPYLERATLLLLKREAFCMHVPAMRSTSMSTVKPIKSHNVACRPVDQAAVSVSCARSNPMGLSRSRVMKSVTILPQRIKGHLNAIGYCLRSAGGSDAENDFWRLGVCAVYLILEC